MKIDFRKRLLIQNCLILLACTVSCFAVIIPLKSKSSENTVLKNNRFSKDCSATRIDMSRKSIKRIEPGAFNCTNNLLFLNLSTNNIEELPVEVFQPLKNLRSLFLDNNRIRNLSQATFSNQILLVKLSLRSNSIDQLPDGLFSTLRSLKELDLGSNKLTSLSPTSFPELKRLEHLSLRGNNLENLTQECFTTQNKLITLDISMNVGIVISNDSFAGLQNLEVLRLNGCNFTELESGTFSEFTKLSELYLHNNHFQEIPALFFLSEMETLDLSMNRLVKITGNDLRELSSLKRLNISFNNITSFDPDSFDSVGNLTVLNISHNMLVPVNETHPLENVIFNLTNLEVLDMSNSSSEEFQIVFPYSSRNLVKLDISRNMGLKLAMNPFVNLEKLETLHMHDCNISLLSGRFMFEQAGESLYLLYSKVHALMTHAVEPEDTEPMHYFFFNNENLTEIDLSRNKLSEIKQRNFRPLKRLRRLDLSRNLIGNVDYLNFSDYENLESVDLSRNSISHLPDRSLFPKKTNLNIDISFNNLTSIKWEAVAYAEVVRATNNKITELNITHMSATKKLTVHLEENEIERVRLDSQIGQTRGAGTYSQIYLQGNKLNCDCHAFQLFEQIGNFSLRSVFADGLICQHPAKLQESDLRNLTALSFICDIFESCPDKCQCGYRIFDEINIVNCSSSDYDQLPLEAPPNTNILVMSYNNLTSLRSLNESWWENLTEVHAEWNRISSEEFYIPKDLTLLYLHNNRMKTLPATINKQAEENKRFEITLADNLWPCECSSADLKTFLYDLGSRARDASSVHCMFSNQSLSNVSLIRMSEQDLCPGSLSRGFSFMNAMSVVLALLGLLLLRLYYKHKQIIQVLIYTYCNPLYRLLCCHNPDEEEKIFDCFISYGSEDRDVTFAILNELEKEPSPEFTFCVHERNWCAGNQITDNIFLSVQHCRKTLIILSESFVKSPWFNLEFQTAYTQTLKDRKNRIIMVIKGNMPDKSELTSDVQHVLTVNTYLEWGERWFWDKLRYALKQHRISTGDLMKVFFQRLANCFRRSRNYGQDIALDTLS